MKNPLLKTSVAFATLTIFSVSFASAADDDKPAGPPNQAAMLKQFDANGDGKLDQTERDAARKHMQSMRGDAGGRGAGRGEGERGQGGRGGPGGQGGQGGRGNPMAQYDTDGDGKLSDAERKAAEPAMREFTQNNERAMQQFDKDGDGKLSDKEWAAARKVVEQRMGQGRGGRGGRGGEGNRGGEGRRQRGE